MSNDSSLVVSLTSTPTTTFLSSTTPLDLNLVLGPHSDPRSWYSTWVQPWLGLLGLLNNLVTILIFGPVLSGWCPRGAGKGGRDGGGVSLVSRIYYVYISFAEVVNVLAGFILRNSVTLLPFAVCLLNDTLTSLSLFSHSHSLSLSNSISQSLDFVLRPDTRLLVILCIF